MWFKLLFAFALIAYVTADVSLQRAAPYPAAGWRPRIPFHLPAETYDAPVESNSEQPEVDPTVPAQVGVEISKERVDFAGQFGDGVANEPQNAYLPPESADRGQELPNEYPQPPFVRPTPPNRRGVFKGKRRFGGRAPPEQQPPQNFQPQDAQQQPEQSSVESQTEQEQQQPSEEFFPTEQNIGEPAQEYGAPGNADGEEPQEPSFQEQDNEEPNEEGQTAIEALNAAVDAYNRARQFRNRNIEAPAPSDEQLGRLSQGQYYIFSPDQMLQRVMFVTTQNAMERETNGFSAQLKYMPVGAVYDPVYKYNHQGQLVRILKK